MTFCSPGVSSGRLELQDATEPGAIFVFEPGMLLEARNNLKSLVPELWEQGLLFRKILKFFIFLNIVIVTRE
jgi:hypothetical protein